MGNQKESGSYYTPRVLADFLVKHLFDKYLDKTKFLKILEPSSGDGEFLDSLRPFVTNIQGHLDFVDTNKDELVKGRDKIKMCASKSLTIKAHDMDFLDFKGDNYSLIIGNPPYISKKYLSKSQIKACAEIVKSKLTSGGEVKNIWPAFLLKGIEKLSPNGVLCYVLPSELLQVKYTSEIRKLILETFQRVEIFAFNQLVFDNIEQDVIAFVGILKHPNKQEHGVSFYQVNKLDDLKIPGYTEKHFNVHREKLSKWTNYILSDQQLSVIDDVTKNPSLKTIKHYCAKSEVGIVTAANKFFILKQSEVTLRKLNNYIVPIIQKSSQLPKTITISKPVLNGLEKKDKAIKLVQFENKPANSFNVAAQAYIKEGQEKSWGYLHRRHKMTQREFWYSVPGIWSSEGLFVKRSHLFPRLLWNPKLVNVTDSFYRVVVKDNYKIKNLVFSFYNSLTLSLAELEGRFYGGGVLELIPSEFRSLLIPYNAEISNKQFSELNKLFASGKSLDVILDFTDPILLPQLNRSQLQTLRLIRKSLFERRTKKTDSPYKAILAPDPRIL